MDNQIPDNPYAQEWHRIINILSKGDEEALSLLNTYTNQTLEGLTQLAVAYETHKLVELLSVL